MKRILSFFLLLCFLGSCLLGCDQDSSSNSSKNESLDNVENNVLNVELSKDDITFLTYDKKSVYKIVNPKNSLNLEDQLSLNVAKYMKSLLGVSIETIDDSVSTNGSYEILIGDTNRSESGLALNYLYSKTGGHYDDYVICTIGKHIVINAFNGDALKNACDYFVNNFLRNEGIKGGINFCHAVEGDFKSISINGIGIGKYRIVRPHFNTSYLTQTEIDKLSQTLYQSYGYKLTVEEDDYTEPFKYEINVGDNNRDGVSKISNHDEYRIEIKGNKVFLNGGSAHATAMAVSEFSKMLEKGKLTDSDAVVGSYEATVKNYDAATTYKPVFYEDFDNDTYDVNKWRLMNREEFGRQGINGLWSGADNDPTYAFSKNGKFYIYAHEDEEGYWGATLTNEHSMAFKFGFVEHSVLCPDGDGFWSLLWFSSSKDGTNTLCTSEIDLNECFGDAHVTNANLHISTTRKARDMGFPAHSSFDNKDASSFTEEAFKNRTGSPKYECPDGKTWSDDFHTFGMVWDENHIAFTADGKVWMSYETTHNVLDVDAFVNTYYYIKLSFSYGRLNCPLDSNNVTDYEMENTSVLSCDWIYLYQLDNGKQSLLLK